MPSTLTPTCPFCGLRYANRPLLELHIREDHLQRNGRGEPDRDPRGTLDIPAPRWRPIPGNGLAPRSALAANEVIAVTATRRPRRPSPGWAMTALRRAIRILRYVKETLVLVLQALFPPADARRPLPAADVRAERDAHLAPVLEYGGPGSRGPGAGPDGAQSRRPQAGGRHRGRGPCGSRAVACPVRPRRRQLRGRLYLRAGQPHRRREDASARRHRGLRDRPRPPGRRGARLDDLPNGVLAVALTGSGPGSPRGAC